MSETENHYSALDELAAFVERAPTGSSLVVTDAQGREIELSRFRLALALQRVKDDRRACELIRELLGLLGPEV